MFFVKTICFFQKYVTVISQGGFTEMNFVAMDFETANHQPYSACSLALVMVKNSRIVDEFYTLIQPETPFFWRNVQIHGIHQEDVRNAPKFPEVWQTIQPYFQKNRLVVAHNAAFDTKVLARRLFPEFPNHRLNTVCENLNIQLDHHHDALEDSRACAEILLYQEKKFGTDPLKKLLNTVYSKNGLRHDFCHSPFIRFSAFPKG